MRMTMQEQAWQSGLVLLDEREEWNDNDWPPLEGGWREHHASVVIDHPDTDNASNKRGETVVVLGGYQQGQGNVNSVLALNLADSNKQWREGPPMNQKRSNHAAVVCNGGIYVMGGYSNGSTLDCMERIDSNDFSALESHWTTLTCRLSTQRFGCCAVAVHNRYIVVMGGYNGRYLSSVDIIDTSTHTVTAGPSMTVPREWCASAVIGHRIYVVGGRKEHNSRLDSVEYIDFAMPCDSEKTKEETAATVTSFSSSWTTHSELELPNARSSCAVVAVGSCLVVAGGRGNSTVEVLDTSRNRVWNFPSLGNHCLGCSIVTVAHQVAVIGGYENPTCATLPLQDKNSWCFRRLFDHHPNEWYQFREGMGNRDVNATSCSVLTCIRKRVRTNTCHGGKEEECT